MQTTLRGQFSGALIQQLERLFRHGTAIGLTEGELLDRFVRSRDEAAFEALIARHGPMVLGVCRQLLRDPHDVDDAFQATFLVLVRKAGTLRRRDLLGNWLYGVAHRVATRSRVLAAKRLARVPHGQDAIDRLEKDDGGAVTVRDKPDEPDPEPSPWLHEEVRRLPEKYRTLVLLCYFEGLSHEQAAARLGCPIGTVKGRLARARDLLRKRLVRRGVMLPAAAAAQCLALSDLRAAVPDSLKDATLQAARATAGTAGASIVTSTSVSLPVATLADGVLQAMIMSKLKAATVTLLVIGAVTTGVVISAAQGPSNTESPSRSAMMKALSEAASPSQAHDRKKARGAAGAVAKSLPHEGEGAARSDTAKGAGPAQARPGMAGTATRQAEIANVEGGGAFDDGSAEEFQDRLTITHLAAVLGASDADKPEPLLKGLDEPIAMSFAKPTPLADVLKHIKTATSKGGHSPLPIYVDPKGLEEADATADSKVVIDLEGVPLKTALRLILKQLRLAYCVRDGVVIISSVRGIREELTEAVRERLVRGDGKLDADPMLEHMGVFGGGMGGAPGGMSGAGTGMMSRGIR